METGMENMVGASMETGMEAVVGGGCDRIRWRNWNHFDCTHKND